MKRITILIADDEAEIADLVLCICKKRGIISSKCPMEGQRYKPLSRKR